MTLVTKNGFCPACMMTKRLFNVKGIKYNEKHISNNNFTLKKQLRDLGITSYPIVEPDNKLDSKSWYGFRPEKINN